MSRTVARPSIAQPLTIASQGTRAALKQLGFSDVYHMITVHKNLETHPAEWIRVIRHKYEGKGEWTKEDWDKLLGQSQSVCDIPGALFGAELAEVYPDAKVVILNRDPEKWYESTLNSVEQLTKPSILKGLRLLFVLSLDKQFRNFISFQRLLYSKALGFDHSKEKEKALTWFQNQYQEFRDKIPEERRIEWTVQEGWGPLCEHLGVPVPTIEDPVTGKQVEAPFPRLNDRVSFLKNASTIMNSATGRATTRLFELIGKAAVTGAVAYFAWQKWAPRR